jgi:hypothetical protein
MTETSESPYVDGECLPRSTTECVYWLLPMLIALFRVALSVQLLRDTSFLVVAGNDRC